MASATGIPEDVPGAQADETEPLLGRVGDASQKDGKPLYYNLTIGMSKLCRSPIAAFTSIMNGKKGPEKRFAEPLVLGLSSCCLGRYWLLRNRFQLLRAVESESIFQCLL